VAAAVVETGTVVRIASWTAAVAAASACTSRTASVFAVVRTACFAASAT